MRIQRYILILFFALETLAITPTKASDHQATFCRNSDISIHTSQSPEATGMSHSGVNVYLHNLSKKNCILETSSRISFLEKKKGELDIHARLLSNSDNLTTRLVLTPAGSNTDTAVITLRWVSNEVFDHNICLTPATIMYQNKHLRLYSSVQAKICGELRKPIEFEETSIQIKKSETVD